MGPGTDLSDWAHPDPKSTKSLAIAIRLDQGLADGGHMAGVKIWTHLPGGGIV